MLSFAVDAIHQTLPCSLFTIVILSSESSPLACLRYAFALFMGSLRLSALHHFRILFLVLLLCFSFPFFLSFYRVFGRYILSLELCSCPSAIFLPSRPRTLLVLDWQPRIILLGMVEARSVTCNLNNTQTYTHSLRESKVQALVEDTWSFRERELVVWTKR